MSVLPSSQTFYLLNTDDLSVKEVTGEYLACRLSEGAMFGNAYLGVDSLAHLTWEHPFMRYLDMYPDHELICVDGAVTVEFLSEFSVNGKHYYIHTIKGDGTAVYLNNILLCRYSIFINIQKMGISYLYRQGNYLIIRYVYVLGSSVILTTIIMSMLGDLVAVLPDDAVDVAECFITQDELFVTKFKALVGGMY